MSMRWAGSRGEQYDLFVVRAKELLDRRIVRSHGLQATFNLNWHCQAGLNLNIPQPDEEDLRSFLVSFRPFVSNDDPVFVNRVHNLLWEDIESDQIRAQLRLARSHWDRACKDGLVALRLNGTRLDSTEVLDLWINGIYFHNDSRKRARLQNLDPVSLFFARFKLLDHLVIATRYIVYLGNLVIGARSDGLLHA